MIRLLLRLFGIKDFDTCKSCATLKEQLAYQQTENKELTKILLDIVKPVSVIQEPSPTEFKSLEITSMPFSRRRAILEERDRQEAQVKKQSSNIVMPAAEIKSINDLEEELNITGIDGIN